MRDSVQPASTLEPNERDSSKTPPPRPAMASETTIRQPSPNGSSAKRLDLHDQTQRLSFPRLIAAYLCLCFCYFISYFDMNSTTTALPTISKALSAGTTITWAGTAFLLGQTVFQPLYGRISDIAGRKPVILASVGCMFIGDLLSGWAQSALWLYLARALSGIGAGGISSLVAIIVSDLVSLKERGKYQGMVSIAIGMGALTGPFVAASLVQRNEDGWRWVFWVPSILAFLCAVTLVFLLPLKPVVGSWREKGRKIDWYGVCASITGIVLLLVRFYDFIGNFHAYSQLITDSDRFQLTPVGVSGHGTVLWLLRCSPLGVYLLLFSSSTRVYSQRFHSCRYACSKNDPSPSC